MFSQTYGVLTSTPTAHTVGSNCGDIETSEKTKNYAFPLVQFSLPSYGICPFFYSEFVETDEAGISKGIILEKNSKGKFIVNSKSMEEIIRFYKEVSYDPLPTPKSWKNRFVELKECNVAGKDRSIRYEIRKINSAVGRSNFPLIGNSPQWLQEPSTPYSKNGAPMNFVGQVGASYFTLYAADIEFYLFYCSVTDGFCQIAQSS